MKRLGILVAAVALVPVLAAPVTATESLPTLSSFQPVFSDQQIVGGQREITVINPHDTAADSVTVGLGSAPCTCAIETVDASHGSIGAGLWDVGTLAPGETATLRLEYTAPQVIAAEARPQLTETTGWELRLGLYRLGSFAIA